jgi:hypothetical protein
MEAEAPVELRAPRTDDRAVRDVGFGFYGYPALLIGHRLGLFPLLDEKPRTLPQVGEALGIKPRPASAILTAAVALGFVRLRDGRYSLTTVAEDYLLERSPTYMGFLWDLTSDNKDVVSFAGLEKACGKSRFRPPTCTSTQTSSTTGRRRRAASSRQRASTLFPREGASSSTKCSTTTT